MRLSSWVVNPKWRALGVGFWRYGCLSRAARMSLELLAERDRNVMTLHLVETPDYAVMIVARGERARQLAEFVSETTTLMETT
jgi:hypothetical protein